MPDHDDLTLPELPPSPWRQINLPAPDERTAMSRLATVMSDAEADGLIDAWFFIRKGQWRVRIRPSNPASAGETLKQMSTRLADLGSPAGPVDAHGVAYESETHAFGGPVGMDATHRLWHADSRHILKYLAQIVSETDGSARPDHRREISVLLLSRMLRAAGLDWYEQGDVWAHVATHHRPLIHAPEHEQRAGLAEQMRHFMAAGAAPDHRLANVSPNDTAPWTAAFTDAGEALARQARHGALTRGLRRILSQQFIFHWNRLGIPAGQQAQLCAAGRTAVFG